MSLRDLVWLLTAFPSLAGFSSPRPAWRAWVCCSSQGIWSCLYANFRAELLYMAVLLLSPPVPRCLWYCESSTDLRRDQLGVNARSHSALEMEVCSTWAASGVAVLCYGVSGDTRAEIKQLFETAWACLSFNVKEESKYGYLVMSGAGG